MPLLPAERAWLVTLNAAASAGGAMDKAHVYVPVENAGVVALDRETGGVEWMCPIETTWPPVADDDRVYLASGDRVYALDAATGKRVWQVPSTALAAPLAVHAGLLLAIAADGTLTAFRVSDGAVLWRQFLGARPRSGAVWGHDGSIFVTLEGGTIVSLNPTDGHRRWERHLTGVLSPPVAGRDRIIVGSTDNVFYAFEAEDGRIAWRWKVGGDAIGAAIDDDVVFLVSLDNVVRAVNRGNGNQRWQDATLTRPAGPPQAVRGFLIVPGVSPTITALDARTGAAAGTYLAAGVLHDSPLIDDAPMPFRVALVAVFRDGRVEGLRPIGLQFRESPVVPLSALPGRAIRRERLPPAA